MQESFVLVKTFNISATFIILFSVQCISLVVYESGAFVTKFRRMMTLIYVCTTEAKEVSEISRS